MPRGFSQVKFMLTISKGDRLNMGDDHYRVINAKAWGNGVVLCLQEIRAKKPARVVKSAFPAATQRHL